MPPTDHRPNEPFEVLSRQQTLDGVLDALVDVTVEREPRLRGQLVDVEHRHRSAGNLLGAAEWIAVELAQQRGNVERGGDRNRQAHPPGSRYKVSKHVLRQRQRLAGAERAHGPARQNLVRRPHVERKSALERKVVRPAHGYSDRAWPGARSRHRHRDAVALLGGELERERLIAVELDGAFAAHGEAVIAGRAFDVVQLELDRAAVAGAQEARQRRGQNHRIAHHHVARSPANLVLAPGHRHHAHGAGKGRDIEVHLRRAVGHDLHDAGIKCERRLRWRRATQFGPGVTTGADLPANALHAVDQLPIEIAKSRR